MQSNCRHVVKNPCCVTMFSVKFQFLSDILGFWVRLLTEGLKDNKLKGKAAPPLPIKPCLFASVLPHYLYQTSVHVCPHVHDAACGLHLSLCAIWSQSVVAVPPHPSVGSSQTAICKTWPSVGPLLRLTALPCTTAPLPHLSSPSSFHITRFTPFPHFHFHTSWAPRIAHCLPLSACLCPSVILPPLPSTCDLLSFIISQYMYMQMQPL